MVFSSLFFLFFFLPLNIILYYSTKNSTLRNIILIVFSLIFYAWGEPVWVGLLLISTIVDYYNGIFIEKHQGKTMATIGIIVTLIFNLGILMTFKYSDFIIENVNFLLGTKFKEPHFLLPIGISFYTFQSISYCIDVYKGQVKAQRSFINYLLFISLYHQLVAGPIVRYSHIANEIENRVFSWEDFSSGVTRFCKGLFKKVAIANFAGEICTQFLDKDISEMTPLAGWYGIFIYGIQIYFDFSGYSDMAIGLGRMFGFHYHENFNHPFISRSITEYWRRWHISLSTWLSDYVFMPVMIKFRDHKNFSIFFGIFFTFFISGLWHGASWNFILWGLYFGIWVYLEKIFIIKSMKKIPGFLHHIYFIILILPSWSLFYFTDLGKLTEFWKMLMNFSAYGNQNIELEFSIRQNIFWIIFAIVLCLPVYQWITKFLEQKTKKNALFHSSEILMNIVFLFVSVMFLVGSSYNPFLYFRF
ncbi:MAG: MBOAT family O-acyltransferase [Bacteroidota bacterium]|jgi:alginate O-acetyltransferase complex protein AlgI